MSLPSLTIHLFGPLRVLIAGEPMPRVRSRSIEWLLALLVLRHGRAVDRAWLAGTLWPDSEEEQARHNLRDALMHLRKAMGSEGRRIQSPTRHTLTLALEKAEVDLVGFDAAMKAGDEGSFQSALALYTGPLLEGCYEEWVGLERESRQQACLMALETLADAAEQRGDYARSLSLLRRAEGMDTLRDTTQRALMRVLAAGGDAPAALAAYREYRLLLREQMNVEPDEETVRLYRQLRQQAAQGTTSTQQPTRLALSSPPVTLSPHSILPHSLTALIGREQQTREIAEAISHSRLVTLVGGGGVGKTRLAIQVAGELASGFADGAAFVALAALSTPALLPAFIASALGIREEATPEPAFLIQALTGWFSTYEVLLVLDNCEHLIEAVSSLTRTLLERCPGLRILATSRQRLGLIGEIAWRVPSLPVPDVEQLSAEARNAAETALEYPAVRLFMERAVMARPGLRLALPEDALAVARICYQLDGIPLAIELAAARVAILSVEQIASRMSDRFRLLAGGSRMAIPRQQTLRALIDWSYDLLTEEERALLCRLSVFAGGWTLEAAEAVCQDAPQMRREASRCVSELPHASCLIPLAAVLDLLASLVDKSLVLLEEGELDIRYRMLETVREYAAEKLCAGGQESVMRDRHFTYYLERARAATMALGGSDPESSVGFLESEMDNLRAALAWAQTQVPAFQDYLDLTTVLWPYWEMRGYLTEGRAHLRTAMSLTNPSDSPVRAQALLGAARLAVTQCDVDEALAFGQECLERFQRQEDTRGMAEALLCLGEAHLIRQDFDRGVPLLIESLDYSHQSAWLPGTIMATMRLGRVSQEQHMGDQGRRFLEEALALAEALGDPRLLAIAYGNLGVLEIAQGSYARARELLEKGLEIRVRLGDRMGIAYTLGSLGDLEKHGDMGRALAYCQQEMVIYRELGNTGEMAHALHRLGNIHYRQGDYEPARQAYAEALDLFMSFQSEVGFEYVRMNLGSTLFHLGDPVRAVELYRQALTLYHRAWNEEGIVWSLERIGVVEAMFGNARKASRLMGAASIMREGLGMPMAPLDKANWEEDVARVRASLQETHFAICWEEGGTMTMEQTIALALEETNA